MRLVVQRVNNAQVSIENSVFSSIGVGLLVFLGVHSTDSKEDVAYLVQKVCALRIFGDENQRMNLSVQDIKAEILLVSQFTLYASTKKGNRPSFLASAPPTMAIPLYQLFISELEGYLGKEKIKTGVFGADMKIILENNGPVTICIDSKNKE